MPKIEERERFLREMICRWENEGGAIGSGDWPRYAAVGEQDAAANEDELQVGNSGLD